ncbi:metal-dependent hydrolase [Flavobacterium psychrophilum]|uniref:Cyclase family protein n=2 Tax=Flavobacterium psychrophilum TaxID=96345 RepID=A0A076NSN9_FLAPS|nr:cyclase family protein [Flavobacterium psychrophilum]AIG29135.1 metal-dependent hydrolase [Flavobacterium psychrophilum]AIG31412.1 metal-dependent hydrolase [Flavobacterium psychrophilum]AIG33569.1 metal-dependent hydrolase [Flavobacterium psychrophilum]AIG35936.1 metal-dependent hydrolase [Flavobacterium psychrophilum]AIG38192.1 metal-dependent hydrolase [Flavobacterium psychrophilum]
MKAIINNQEIDLSKPIDISIPLTNTDKNPIAWYLNKPEIEPVTVGDWIGKVSEGKSSTNFNNIFFNPHGHGTHTECLGHITNAFYSINQCLKQFFFTAELISVKPKTINGDLVITKEQIKNALNKKTPEAIVIRTLPNIEEKKHKKYSHTNPPYLAQEAAVFIREIGIQHLLIDLPSVDREEDEGKLLAHKAFWNVKDVNNLNEDARLNCTITELIYADNTILDGSYILNLQIAPFENDASPSKPILFKI